jgi:hypothetical protein
MQEALWLNMESTKKKHEWRDRTISEHKNKRLRTSTTTPEEPRMTPFPAAPASPPLPPPVPTTTASSAGRNTAAAMEVDDEEDGTRAHGTDGTRKGASSKKKDGK